MFKLGDRDFNADIRNIFKGNNAVHQATSTKKIMMPLSKTICLKILITTLTYDSIILGLGII